MIQITIIVDGGQRLKNKNFIQSPQSKSSMFTENCQIAKFSGKPKCQFLVDDNNRENEIHQLTVL